MLQHSTTRRYYVFAAAVPSKAIQLTLGNLRFQKCKVDAHEFLGAFVVAYPTWSQGIYLETASSIYVSSLVSF